MENGGFSMDGLIELLADRVAAKVRAELSTDGSRCTVQPRLLTVKQAAVRIGRSKEAVQHMVAVRKLPIVRDGRRVFLDIQDLDRWIEANKEPAHN